MGKRLIKNGHSLALVIDRTILKPMRFTLETEFVIRPRGKALVVRKAGSDEKIDDEEIVGENETGKKLIKAGNSYALIIGKALLEMMEFTQETELEIRPFGKGFLIRRTGGWESKAEIRRREKEEEKKRANEMFVALEEHEDDEKSPSQKLVLVDGKWVLPKPGPSNVGVSKAPDKALDILEAIRSEEKKEREKVIRKKGIQKKVKGKKAVGRPGKVGKW